MHYSNESGVGFKTAIMILVACAIGFQGRAQSTSVEAVEDALFDLPNVRFERTSDGAKNFEGAWNLKIRQPLDHDDPERGFFYQRVYLSHLDVN